MLKILESSTKAGGSEYYIVGMDGVQFNITCCFLFLVNKKYDTYNNTPGVSIFMVSNESLNTMFLQFLDQRATTHCTQSVFGLQNIFI